jgi:lipopolysaccharide transport system permease protein
MKVERRGPHDSGHPPTEAISETKDHSHPGAPPVTVLEPAVGLARLDLTEVWRYRDLLFVLVWRDISANYRQSIIGFGWALFKPIFSLMVFTLIFGKVANMPSDGIAYPLFCFAGLLPWMYFATCLQGTSQSVVGGGYLVTKVYFPRLILPLTSAVSGLVDFSVQFVLFVGMILWYTIQGWHPDGLGWGFLLVPVFLLLCMVVALSVGLWLTALNVKYRDVGQLVPFLIQMWMWLTPIVYPSTLVPARWRLLYGLNPMTGVVEGFRWALFPQATAPDWGMVSLSLTVVAILFVGGLYFFRSVERTFADVL